MNSILTHTIFIFRVFFFLFTKIIIVEILLIYYPKKWGSHRSQANNLFKLIFTKITSLLNQGSTHFLISSTKDFFSTLSISKFLILFFQTQDFFN